MPKPACACMIIIQTVAFGNKEHTKERKLENRFLQDITKTCLYNVVPFNPLLYSKTGVYKDTYIIFFYFAKKHRLWVLVRTASPRRFQRVPTIYVLSRNMKNIRLFYMKIFLFLVVKFSIFVCVEILRLCQPNGVMSSAVSLPSHTFTGQA